MECFECGRQMECSKEIYHFEECGLDNVFLDSVEVCKCPCGEVEVCIPAMKELHQLIGLQIIRKDSLLNGKEIKFLRKSLGLSGIKLHQIMGANNSTISRWESGSQPISEPNDKLLRMIYVALADLSLVTKEDQITVMRSLVNNSFPGIKTIVGAMQKYLIPVNDLGACSIPSLAL